MTQQIHLCDLVKSCAYGKSLYIWGAWERGRILSNILKEQNIEIDGFIDANKKGSFHSKPIYRFDELKNQSDIFFLLSIVEHQSVRTLLEKNHFSEVKDYLYLGSEIRLNGSSGFYLDAFQNRVCSKTNINNAQIKLSIGSTIEIGKNVTIGDNVVLAARGHGNITIGDNVKIGNNVSIVCDDDSVCTIGNHVTIFDNCVLQRQRYSTLQLGDKTTLNRVDIRSVYHSRFLCGKDCMFSYGINARTHDGHAIIDEDNQTIYQRPSGIVIGNHVWLGMNATILPGSCIGNDSVIGAGSLVNKTIDDHSMVVGIPGKVIRTGVNWDRRKDITYEEFCQQKGE